MEIAGPRGGTWAIDLTRDGGPDRVARGDDPRTRVRIRIAEGDLANLHAGRQRWTDAFVRVRIDLRGDILLALKLRKLFAEATRAS